VRRDALGLHVAVVADVAAAVDMRIGVEHLAIAGRRRHADAVVGAHDRREVAHHDDEVVGIARAAQERDDAVLIVVRLDPEEALGMVVALAQRRRGAIEPVEVLDQELDALVRGILEQVPVEAAVMVPFARLRDLVAHEQQLLAGVAEHEGVVSTQVGALLPRVARHLVDHGALAVHDLVVRQRQHEVLAEGVDQAEGQLVVVVAAMHGSCAM
jgi:hypothetical protein